MLKKIIILIVLILRGVVALAYPLEFDGFVSDNAHVLSPRAIYEMNALLYDLQKKTGSDLAVVALKTLNNRPIEETALKIARDAKLGAKGKNNGALILVVPPENKSRIEIGYGLEGIINDAKAGRILDEYMIPYFNNNDYEKGILLGTYVLAGKIADGYGVELEPDYNMPSQMQDDRYLDLMILLFLLFLLFGGPGGFFIFPGGFGGFGGGSGGIRFGGGGGFGGGGATRVLRT